MRRPVPSSGPSGPMRAILAGGRRDRAAVATEMIELVW